MAPTLPTTDMLTPTSPTLAPCATACAWPRMAPQSMAATPLLLALPPTAMRCVWLLMLKRVCVDACVQTHPSSTDLCI